MASDIDQVYYKMAESQYFASEDSYNDYLQEWYPLVQELTFKTWIIPFERSEAEMLYKTFRHTYAKADIEEKFVKEFPIFREKINKHLDDIKAECPKNSGFFVRLGSRSPKDGMLYSEKAKQRFVNLLYREYEKEYLNLGLSSKDDKVSWINSSNTMNDYRIIARCENCSMKCKSVDEMFDLFFNSERVLRDLRVDLDQGSTKFAFIIRLWNDEVRNHLEFRGFVCQNKLTALVQYDYNAYFEDIDQNKEGILNAIQTLYDTKVFPILSRSDSPFPNGCYVI